MESFFLSSAYVTSPSSMKMQKLALFRNGAGKTSSEMHEHEINREDERSRSTLLLPMNTRGKIPYLIQLK
jgi:hypothetical protein